jgi:hypothetical protein
MHCIPRIGEARSPGVEPSGGVEWLSTDFGHTYPIIHSLIWEPPMTTITLDIPDALAERLAQRRDQLPQLLAMALELSPGEPPPSGAMPPPDHPVFTEMIDFLASGPTSAQIVAFKISSTAQRRLDALLDKHREQGLTAEETAELDTYAQVNHILLLLKARARLATPTQK